MAMPFDPRLSFRSGRGGRAPLAHATVALQHAEREHASRMARLSSRVTFGAYGAMAALALVLAWLLGKNPFATPAWLGTSGATAVVLSAGLGLLAGAVAVAVTHAMLERFAWVRALRDDLGAVVRGEGDRAIAAAALASGVGEELLFRGVLTPLLGLALASLAFGVVHQARGRGRVGWMAWAAVMGLVFGALFLATGSLVGSIVAHVYVNAHNLRLLRGAAPKPLRAATAGGTTRATASARAPADPRASRG